MSDADLQIRQCLDEKKSFVLDAGAGSGKTYSLVLALQHLLATRAGELRRAGQQIACITYTNVAKDQVSGRTGRSQLIRVLTIHEFLWDQMRPHQRALKAAVIKVNNALPADSTRKKDVAALREALGKVNVTYSDTGSNFLEGRLHHDDLLTVARTLFEDHPLLSKLVAAKHPYLFVDEYQDADMTGPLSRARGRRWSVVVVVGGCFRCRQTVSWAFEGCAYGLAKRGTPAASTMHPADIRRSASREAGAARNRIRRELARSRIWDSRLGCSPRALTR